MPLHSTRVAVILLPLILAALSLLCACSRPPAENATNSNSQNLPFDHQPHSTGVSPSQTLVPSATKLPEGTPIPIRLESTLSSASSHTGDSFYASVDESVEIDGQTVIARGTPVAGRVLEAKAAGVPESSRESSNESALEPGYLRIVLVSVRVGGKPVAIETSSIFAKGGSREERKPSIAAPSGRLKEDNDKNDKNRDAVFALDRRLNFRLAQAVDLR
ncbi:MAG TPA: hypothetical protein VIH78_13435 [Terriglobales bacterium]